MFVGGYLVLSWQNCISKQILKFTRGNEVQTIYKCDKGVGICCVSKKYKEKLRNELISD